MFVNNNTKVNIDYFITTDYDLNWNYLFKESNYNEILVIVFIIALFKEQIWDRLMKKGTYELNDIIATMIGWLVSTILNIIWII
jgi:hypothetical protein